jgi:hypothetical protein
MGSVMDRDAQEILDELRDHGKLPTEAETAALCEAALDGQRFSEALDALEHALNKAGWSVVDLTTDDTEGTVFDLVPPVGDDV